MDRIGRYKIISKVGEGGMGVVYKARHPTLDNIVALKTISASLDATPEIRQRFHVEARSAALLSHENIIRVIDYDEYKGKAFMVLEFLDGTDLKAEIKRIKDKQRQPFSLDQSIQIMLGVCKGLSHAHQRGIYHRDIKPANIFVTNSGQVKILDFGLAKIVSDQVTLTSAKMGTPAYMSPEQLVDGKSIDQRSDIFSAGVLFYELLTYCQPFTGDSWHEIEYKIAHIEPKPVETINKLIPTELSTIIQKALAKDREKRYQEMSEVQDDLEYFRQDLEARKRELQAETKNIIGKLEGLIQENQDLLKERAARMQQVMQDSPTVMGQLGLSTGKGELQKRTALTLDYWEIAEIYERAKQEYGQLNSIVRKRDQFDALLAQAEALIQKGDLVAALESLESILRDVPSHSDALALKEKISARLKETRSEAIKQERAQEFLKLAESSFSAGDFTGCLAFAAEVLKLVPNHGQAILLLDQAQEKIKEVAKREEARRNAERELVSARDALAAGNFTEARVRAQSARDIYPDSREASRLLLEIGDAEQKQREKLSRQKKIADLLLEAQELQSNGKSKAALDRIKEVLAIEPDHHSAIILKDKVEGDVWAQQRSDELFKMAADKYASDDLTECYPLLTEALKLQPAHPSAKALLERTKQKIKERAERQEKRRQATAALDHARAALNRGDLEAARIEAETAQKQYPDSTGATELLEEIRRAREEQRIRQARELQAARLIEAAKSHLQAGQENDALKLLDEVKSIVPGSPEAAELAGQIAQAREKREREQKERREALSKAFRQAQEAERSGDLKRAGELAESILAQDITHSGARDLLARVEAEILRRQRQEQERRQNVSKLLQAFNEARSAGQLDKALAALDNILVLDSARDDLAGLRSQIQTQLDAERARRAQEAEAQQQKQLGLKLVDRSSFRDGLAALQKAKKLLMDDPEVLSAIAQAEEEIRADETRLKIQSGVAKSRQALSQESYAEATERVHDVLLLDPGNAEARELQSLIERAFKEHQTREKIASYLSSARQALGREEFHEATELACKALLLDRENSEARELVEKIDRTRQQKHTREKIASLLAQSSKALSAEDFEEADTRAREVLLLDPASSEARELIQRIQTAHNQWHLKKKVTSLMAEARGNWSHGDLEKAVRLLEEALQLDPENKTAGSLLKKLEEQIRAQEERRKQEHIAELLDQVQRDKEQARFTEAIRVIDEILALDSSRRDVKELRRQIMAELDADKTRQIKTAEAEREKQQGIKMLAQKRYQESLSAFSRAKEVLGAQPDIEAAVAEAEAGLKAQELYSRIQSDLSDARQALRKEDFYRAAGLANAVLYLEPANAEAKELLKQIDRIREEKDTREGIAKSLSLCRQALAREDTEQAMQLAAKVLLLDPQNADAKELQKRIEEIQEKKQRRSKLAALLAQSNEALGKHRFEDAQAIAREVLLLDPQNADANGLLNRIQEAQGKRSINTLKTELLIEAHDAREKQQFAVALSKIDEVLQLDPKHKEARVLGSQIEKERRAFEKERLRQAKQAGTRSQTGETASEATVLIVNPKLRFARIAITSAVGVLAILLIYQFLIKPKEGSSYPAQTVALFENGKYDAARQKIANWLQQEPGNPTAKKLMQSIERIQVDLNAHDAAKKEGNYKAAFEALERVSKANALDPTLAQRRKQLDEMFSTEFADNFLYDLSSWITPAGWKIVTIGKIKALSVQNGLGFVRNRYYRNFEMDFNVQFVRGDSATWILRVQDENNYYMFRLTGPKANPPDSFSGYVISNGKVSKNLLSNGVGLNLGTPGAQFQINITGKGTRISHTIRNATSPNDNPPGPYVVVDDTYPDGTVGFKSENNTEFNVIGGVIVYSISNSLSQ